MLAVPLASALATLAAALELHVRAADREMTVPDVWGDDDLYRRKARAAKHRRTRAAKRAKARRKAKHRRPGCFGIFLATLAGCVLWAVVLVPLILWGPL